MWPGSPRPRCGEEEPGHRAQGPFWKRRRERHEMTNAGPEQKELRLDSALGHHILRLLAGSARGLGTASTLRAGVHRPRTPDPT